MMCLCLGRAAATPSSRFAARIETPPSQGFPKGGPRALPRDVLETPADLSQHREQEWSLSGILRAGRAIFNPPHRSKLVEKWKRKKMDSDLQLFFFCCASSLPRFDSSVWFDCCPVQCLSKLFIHSAPKFQSSRSSSTAAAQGL